MIITTELLTCELVNQSMEVLIDLKTPHYNLKLLNFDLVLRDTFNRFNADCTTYSVPNDFKGKDTQKIFINSLIISICEKIKENKSYTKIALYINRNTVIINDEERHGVFNIILKTIKKLPFQFIVSDIPVDFFISRIHNNVVDSVVLLETQLQYTNNYDTLKFSFKALYKFLEKNKLTYLYDVYFKRIGNKLLVVR